MLKNSASRSNEKQINFIYLLYVLIYRLSCLGQGSTSWFIFAILCSDKICINCFSEDALSDCDEQCQSPTKDNCEAAIQKDTDKADVDVFDDMEQTDDGAASWLEALGLDKKRFHSLDPNRVRLYPYKTERSNNVAYAVYLLYGV